MPWPQRLDDLTEQPRTGHSRFSTVSPRLGSLAMAEHLAALIAKPGGSRPGVVGALHPSGGAELVA